MPILTTHATPREVRVTAKTSTKFDVQFRTSAGGVIANGTSIEIDYVVFA